MDNDDRQIGRILRRREVLALIGGTGGAAFLAPRILPGMSGAAATLFGTDASTLAAANTAFSASNETTYAADTLAQSDLPSCVVKPELTEGPYFVDSQLDRSDIRVEPSDGSIKPGVPLTLAFTISQIANGGCTSLANAKIDVWHCDALGVYSGVNDNIISNTTSEQKFLRGYQLTDADGHAQFTTIYPGWYTGRAVHIHFKIRTTSTTGDAYEFTSQFFFDDSLSDQIFTLAPYTTRTGRRMRNADDNIYQSGGDQLLLNSTASGDGYAATFAMGLDLSDMQVGAPDGNGASGAGGPGRPGPGGQGPRAPGGPGGAGGRGLPPRP